MVDADADADVDVDGIVSMWTPSVLTTKLQNGNDLLGGRFFATVTCNTYTHSEKYGPDAHFNEIVYYLTSVSTGRRVFLIPHNPLEC
jgi:hypothetical protein